MQFLDDCSHLSFYEIWERVKNRTENPSILGYVRQSIYWILTSPEKRSHALLALKETEEEYKKFGHIDDTTLTERNSIIDSIDEVLRKKKYTKGILRIEGAAQEQEENLPSFEKAIELLSKHWQDVWQSNESLRQSRARENITISQFIEELMNEEIRDSEEENRFSIEMVLRIAPGMFKAQGWGHPHPQAEVSNNIIEQMRLASHTETHPVRMFQRALETIATDQSSGSWEVQQRILALIEIAKHFFNPKDTLATKRFGRLLYRTWDDVQERRWDEEEEERAQRTLEAQQTQARRQMLGKQFALCQTPDDFIKFFEVAGVPEKKWKDYVWVKSHAIDSKKDGGIETDLRFVVESVAADARFGNYPNFVAFVEKRILPGTRKKGAGKERIMTREVRKAQTPEQFLDFFHRIGIEEDRWKSGYYVQKTKKLSGLYLAIRSDARFRGSYPFFVAWMERRLPLHIQSEEEAREILQKEILRLRRSNNRLNHAEINEEILDEEWQQIRKPKFYETNIVVKNVADYLRSLQNQEKKC